MLSRRLLAKAFKDLKQLYRGFSFETTNNFKPLYKILAPSQFSERLSKSLQEQISSFSATLSPSVKVAKFNPTSKKDIQSQRYLFENLLSEYPDFKKQIEEARNSSIVLISGLKVLTVPQDGIPTSIYRSEEAYKYSETKVAEIVAGLILEKFVEIDKNQNAFNLIYRADEDIGKNNSYASDKEILWHNDRWESQPEGQVALFCVNGNESVITEIITVEQIIDYFKSNNMEDLLKALQDDFIIQSSNEEYFKNTAKIIDKDQIRYAQYGSFKSKEIDKAKFSNAMTAISELNKCLENIAPIFGKALENGDFLLIDNNRNIHRRKTADGKLPMKPRSRFVLRGNIVDERIKVLTEDAKTTLSKI
jgi:hypothetical protein